jgi:glycosyltransferase involved in cell wall biosynthesis
LNTNSAESSDSILISVVVCTFNRAGLLEISLQSLSNQLLEDSGYEVIVADNNSTDNTRQVVSKFRHSLTNLRYCFEAKQGLSYARNRGWQEARGEYVAYIDDDCKVPEQWLTVAKKIIEQISPDVFGGPYFAFYNTPKPHWFKDAYGSRDLGNVARELTDGEYLSGGNIFFRRELLEILGGFDVSFGMSGQRLAYGEETALLKHIRETMPERVIYCDPEMYVHHLVHSKKMSLPWIIRQRFVGGRYSYRVFKNNGSISGPGQRQQLRQSVGNLLKDILNFARNAGQRDRVKYPYLQNYLYEHVFQYIDKVGVFFEHCLQTFRYKR